MQTYFSLAQLADPDLAEAENILRRCVHCGFCNATCPTYLLLGDERDSPRGRIYALKDMLETDRAPTKEEVLHLDRCLSCLSCKTTCPSGVDYQHLIDYGRAYIEKKYRRPLRERWKRKLLTGLMAHSRLFRLALRVGILAAPFAQGGRGIISAATRLARRREIFPAVSPGIYLSRGNRKGRVALLAGCVQDSLYARINIAALRLLTAIGYEVIIPEASLCCGAIALHHGDRDRAAKQAETTAQIFSTLQDDTPLDAIITTAAGCGTVMKDYAHVLGTALGQDTAARVRDLAEFLAAREWPSAWKVSGAPAIAYQAPCSLTHGQGLGDVPLQLLRRAGYLVEPLPENHLCCGSAGTYNLLQPAIAEQLRARKLSLIHSSGATMVATANIGCAMQLQESDGIPVRHVAELLADAVKEN